MKLSEIPVSFYHQARLALKKPSQLQGKGKPRLPVIVSLTSIPSRLHALSTTVRSLLCQDALPEKIVLWLHHDLEETLPRSLASLQGDIFEIRYSPYTFSHRKLIHSLDAFPDRIIITCDDDLIYHPSALKMTYEQHLKHPDCVIGNRCREISYDAEGAVRSYLQWPFVKEAKVDPWLLMPVGAFLVLYPPGILDEEAKNVDLFTEIAPKSDDLWFKTCALLKGKRSMASTNPPPEPIPVWGTQKVALKHVNNKMDFNRNQWEAISKHFGFKLPRTEAKGPIRR
ncbi:glycosyltransferase family A protein [Flagellimonas sp. DF-77]|uniref:glycosyltransferase family A protein n=1 Tax=Flagellimonas algarum TaxID=3230298 RepID=UPI003399EBDE